METAVLAEEVRRVVEQAVKDTVPSSELPAQNKLPEAPGSTVSG